MSMNMREKLQGQVWDAWARGLSIAQISRVLPTRHISVRTLIGAKGGIFQRFRRQTLPTIIGGYRCSMPEAVIARKDDRLGARPYAQLVEQIRRMIAHCLLTNPHALCYVGVAQTFGDKS
jgi:hypothetical protein